MKKENKRTSSKPKKSLKRKSQPARASKSKSKSKTSRVSSSWGKTLVVRKKTRKKKDEFARLQEISNGLPYSYNQTKLILLARDPFWGYSYWDFSGKTWGWIQDLCKWHPEFRAVLRVYNISESKNFDIDVSLEAKNWYLSLGKPNCEFEAELGLLGSDGKFYVIAKSNRIRAPRNAPSDIIDPQWAPENFEELYKLSGGELSGRSSDLSSQFKKKRSKNP